MATTPARYIMIGGFLGAGKTTSVSKLAQHLTAQGLRVGLITNDQGSELVDTAMLRSRGFATEEISGGCFCCRFNSLMEAAGKLTTATRPDVFIAEPVGSCTDLVATVTYPLRRLYGDNFTVAPLSVLVDPVRAQRILGLTDGGKFSDKVLYIYRKQLEEADLIVINKRELLEPDALATLQAKLLQEFPRARVLAVSARTGVGLEEWFGQISREVQPAGQAMAVDYEVYADGEALLGWLNCTVQIRARSPFDGNALLRTLAGEIQKQLASRRAEIAHLKMTLSPNDNPLGDLAVINVVRNDLVPELSQELSEPVGEGEIIINCRAETDPDSIAAAVNLALLATRGAHVGVEMTLQHSEHFRPGKPQPTHRMARLED